MNDNLILASIILGSLLLGGLIGWLLTRLKNRSQVEVLQGKMQLLEDQVETAENNRLEMLLEVEKIRDKNEGLKIEMVKYQEAYKNLSDKNKEQREEVEKLNEKFNKEFQIMANKIMEEKSTKFAEQNKENIKTILDPLQEKIQKFEKKVEETHKESIDRHAALRQQILGLKELNEQMSKEAVNLTKALKGDSKMQGNWGELVLERVLEKSGLEKDREYHVQQSFAREDGSRVMPDVVINLPDNKKMVIDSKVSLTAYERYVNADSDDQERFLKEHVSSIKKHVEELSGKRYEDLYEIESPDFVLMFIPIEPAFAIALNNEDALYNKAFEKNIVIVTPTTLLATLRTIDTMWNNEKQQQNAIEIATSAGRLYDQFVNLTDDLLKVGNQLKTVQGSYDTTMKKLTGKGNLITKVEGLKKLGIKQKKHMNDKLLKRAEDNEDDT